MTSISRLLVGQELQQPRSATTTSAGKIIRGARAIQPLGTTARASRLSSLIAAGGWVDAAIALIELEAPDWRVRRLERDGGEWVCSLSRYEGVPREFDDSVDGRDSLLAIAILEAFAEARRRGRAEPVLSDESTIKDRASTTVSTENCF